MCLVKLVQQIRTECSEASLAIREKAEPRAEACLKHASDLLTQYFEGKAKDAETHEVDSP